MTVMGGTGTQTCFFGASGSAWNELGALVDIKLTFDEASNIAKSILKMEPELNAFGDTLKAITDAETKKHFLRKYGQILGILLVDIEQEVLKSAPELCTEHPRKIL
jgi:hypothetical protein